MKTFHRADGLDHALMAVAAAQLAAAAIVATLGPDGGLPMHFDLQGQVDRWADRWQVVALLASLAVVTFLSDLAIRARRRRAPLDGGARSALALGGLILVVVLVAVTALLTGLGLGTMRSSDALAFATHGAPTAAWAILAILGAVVGKAAPNDVVGVRVFWTLHSRIAWDKANRLLGRIFFLGGLAGLAATPFLDPRANIALVLILALGGAAASIWEARRVWRADPERELRAAP
jgi:uncharacterized membrane protein